MSTFQTQYSGEPTLQYCVYSWHEQFDKVIHWIIQNNIKFEVRANRTRFWVPDGPVLTEFLLRYSNVCPPVKERMDNDYALC
jgi:hypothetical protein